ncbi:MAG: class I SAM-dependent methyltransferase, partial [Anaerolineae bacterium]
MEIERLVKYDLPAPEMLVQQAEWLAPARGRLFRQIRIARRKCVLDLGAGYGAVTGELVRRARGPVVALDCATAALREGVAAFAGAQRTGGDALRLRLVAAAGRNRLDDQACRIVAGNAELDAELALIGSLIAFLKALVLRIV